MIFYIPRDTVGMGKIVLFHSFTLQIPCTSRVVGRSKMQHKLRYEPPLEPRSELPPGSLPEPLRNAFGVRGYGVYECNAAHNSVVKLENWVKMIMHLESSCWPHKIT